MISNHRQITRVVRERETEKERKKREGKRNRERERERERDGKRERQTEKERGEIVIALTCQTNCHTVHEGKPDETSKF